MTGNQIAEDQLKIVAPGYIEGYENAHALVRLEADYYDPRSKRPSLYERMDERRAELNDIVALASGDDLVISARLRDFIDHMVSITANKVVADVLKVGNDPKPLPLSTGASVEEADVWCEINDTWYERRGQLQDETREKAEHAVQEAVIQGIKAAGLIARSLNL